MVGEGETAEMADVGPELTCSRSRVWSEAVGSAGGPWQQGAEQTPCQWN